MIIPDVNILVHAHDLDFPGHHAAKLWWEDQINEPTAEIGIAWASILGFLRLSTNRAVAARPIHATAAIAIVRSWFQQDSIRIILPGEQHAEILFDLLENVGVAGNLTTDAHLAALAIEYRSEVATTDTDFARFPGVRWFNPLASKKH